MENTVHITDNPDKLNNIFENKYREEKKEPEKKIQIGIILDITGSMHPYIEACKAGVSDLIEKNKTKVSRCLEVGIVGYRDKGDEPKLVKREFFKSEDKIDWEGFYPSGGGDLPEDLVMGMENCLSLKWDPDAYCKLVVILTDAPTHGTRYHNGLPDDYPNEHKLQKNIEYWTRQFADKGVNLFLINFTETTEKMNKIIRETYYNYIKEKKINLICSVEERKSFQSVAQKELNEWFIKFIDDTIVETTGESFATVEVVEPEPELEVIPEPEPEVKLPRVYPQSIFCVSVDGSKHSEYAFNLIQNDILPLNKGNKLLAVHIFNLAENDKYDYKNKKETIIAHYETIQSTNKNIKFVTDNRKKESLHILEQVNKTALLYSAEYLFCGYFGMKGPKGDKNELTKGVHYLLGNSVLPTMIIKENTLSRKEKGGYNWMFVLDRAYSVNCLKTLNAFLPLVNDELDSVFGYILLPSYDNYDDISKTFLEELEKVGIQNFELETVEYSSTTSPSTMINEKINYGDKPFDFVIFYNIPEKHKREKEASDVVNIITHCMSNIGFVNQ